MPGKVSEALYSVLPVRLLHTAFYALPELVLYPQPPTAKN